MGKKRYESFEKRIEETKQRMLFRGKQFLKKHPGMKYPLFIGIAVFLAVCRLILCIVKSFDRLMDLIRSKKKPACFLFVSAVLICVAVISVVKIARIYNAETKQEQEIADLQEEYVSVEAAEEETIVEEIQEESVDAISKVEDNPEAWYHDIDVDFAGLKGQNEDIIGWIYFEDEESISYPLLYSGDDYYLRRNYLKEEETAGSIYIDGNNSSDLSDAHTLIYGHNMRNLTMFGKLKYYKTEEDYLENHRYFQLITEDASYRYEIFAYKEVNTLTGGIYTTWKYVDEEFKKFVENTIIAGSYVDADIDVDDETHIVTLSTCSYDSDVRFTVNAVRVDEHEWK